VKTFLIALSAAVAIVAALRVLGEWIEWPRPRKPRGSR
jgi:hypothetical protein